MQEILPVYEKVYNHLKKLNKDTIPCWEFYRYIENMKIHNGTVCNKIKKDLLAYGLTQRQIEVISRKLSYTIRFTRRDARDIEKALIQLGWIQRTKHNITLKRQS